MSDLKVGGVDMGDVARDAALDALNGALDDATEITQDAVEEFATQIGNDMLEASIANRPDLIEELAEQSVLLAEEKRILLTEAGKARLITALKVVGKVVWKVAAASLGLPPIV
jgi:hypothetical protein